MSLITEILQLTNSIVGDNTVFAKCVSWIQANVGDGNKVSIVIHKSKVKAKSETSLATFMSTEQTNVNLQKKKAEVEDDEFGKDDPSSGFEALYTQSVKYFDNSKYDDFLTLSTKALNLLSQIENKEDYKLKQLDLTYKIGKTHFKRYNSTQAYNIWTDYNTNIKTLNEQDQKTLTDQRIEVLNCLQDISKENQSKKDDTLQIQIELIQILQSQQIDKESQDEQIKNLQVLMGNMQNDVGMYYFQKNILKQSLPYFQDSLKYYRLAYGNTHLGVAFKLHNLAEVLSGTNNFDQAIQAFQECIQIKKQNYKFANESVAYSLMSLANCYQKSKKYDNAINSYDDADKIYKQVYKDDEKKYNSVKHGLLFGQGEVYFNQKPQDDNQAQKCYQLAIKCYSESLEIRIQPEYEVDPKIIVRTKKCLADSLFFIKGETGQESLKKAMGIYLEIADDYEKQNSIGLSAQFYYNFSIIAHSLKDGDNAVKFAEKSVQLIKRDESQQKLLSQMDDNYKKLKQRYKK